MNKSYGKFFSYSAAIKEMLGKNREIYKIISLTLKNNYTSIYRHVGTV